MMMEEEEQVDQKAPLEAMGQTEIVGTTRLFQQSSPPLVMILVKVLLRLAPAEPMGPVAVAVAVALLTGTIKPRNEEPVEQEEAVAARAAAADREEQLEPAGVPLSVCTLSAAEGPTI